MTHVDKRWAVGTIFVLLFLVSVAGVAMASRDQTEPVGVVAIPEHRNPDFFADTGGTSLSCARCHNDFPLIVVSELGNAGFTIDDCGGNMGRQCAGLFTDGYTPGRLYQMRAIISYPGMSSWGFDLWVTDDQGNTAGTLSGQRFRSATHNRTQDGIVVGAVGNEGVGFRQNGRYDGPVGWRFSWRAPATDIGPVRFFAEGTAANRDRTPHGDYSYVLDGIVVYPVGAK